MKKFFISICIVLMCITMTSCNRSSKDETEKIIDQMSLRQKAAQLLIPSFRYNYYRSSSDFAYLTSLTPEIEELIKEYGFGGVILFAGNIEEKDQSLKLIEDFKAANDENNPVPLLVCADQEGGNVRRISFGTFMPGNMALGATGSTEDITRYASVLGDELKDLGINTDFAPVVDINSNPNNPVIGIRSYSDDPQIVASMTKPFIDALHEHGIISSLKHFPGHGDTDTDSHSGLPSIHKTYEEILGFELIPFKAGIEADCDMIMSAHIQYPNIETKTHNGIYLPATLSHKFLTEILREELGFDKVIVTDSLAMDAITKYFHKTETIEYAINAGADMLLIPVADQKSVSLYMKELENYVTAICNLVKEGKITEERIDESLRRIITLKKERGFFGKSENDGSYDVGSREHRAIEMDIAEKAITLIANDEALPIQKDEKVVVLAPYRTQINSLTYTKKLLLEKGLLNKEEDLEIVYYGDETSAKDFRNNILPELKNKDKLILISSLYDESDLNGIESYIIDRCIEYGEKEEIKTIVLSSQLPYDLDRYDSDAILACYYASGMSFIPALIEEDMKGFPPNLIAAMLVMYGDQAPQGKLPIDVPKIIKKDGLYAYSDETAYSRGYQISY